MIYVCLLVDRWRDTKAYSTVTQRKDGFALEMFLTADSRVVVAPLLLPWKGIAEVFQENLFVQTVPSFKYPTAPIHTLPTQAFTEKRKKKGLKYV